MPGNRLVEGRIEHRDVDSVRNMLARCPVSRQAARIVEWCERAQFIDSALDTGVNDQRPGERAAMHHAMADPGHGFPAERGREGCEGRLKRVWHAGDAFNEAFAE